MSETNPYLPEFSPDANHMADIMREAFQEWVQRTKTPYTVQGPRGPMELTDQDFFRMSTVIITLIRDNSDKVDIRLKRKV